MYRCPVCRHASINWLQHNLTASFSPVVCRKCGTELHNRFRWKYLLPMLPFIAYTQAQRLGWTTDGTDTYVLIAATAVSFAMCGWVNELEPTAPPKVPPEAGSAAQ
jgi:hypothetical protein